MITVTETRDYKLIAQLSEELFNLHAKLYPEIFKHYNQLAIERTTAEMLIDPNCKCYVARQNETNIGFAIFFIRASIENEFMHNFRSIYIDQIAVLSQYQKTGAGQLLMEQAEKLAKELSITHLTLEHWTDNTTAASYFRKKGFAPYRERLMKTIDV